jgi:hypothetical protein
MRSFWKILFISPPEDKGRLLLNQKQRDYDASKLDKNRALAKANFPAFLISSQ